MPEQWLTLAGVGSLNTSQCAGVILFNTFLRTVELPKLFLSLALAGFGARLTQLLLVTGECGIPCHLRVSAQLPALRTALIACAFDRREPDVGHR